MKRLLLVTALLLTGSIYFASCKSDTKPAQSSEKDKDSSEIIAPEKHLPQGALPILYQSHLYLKSMVDSVEGYFVFDSGADKLYIDSTFYAENNFHHDNVAVAKLPGVGNEIQTIPLILDEIQLSFLGLSRQTVQTPIIQLKSLLGDLADGILGNQLLSEKIMAVNYCDEYIILYDHIDSIDLTGYSKMDCEKVKNRFYVQMEINIDGSLVIKDKFLLDIGSGGSVSLTSPAAINNQLADVISQKSLYTTNLGGIGGESSSYDFRAHSVKIGDFHFDQVSIDYSNDKAGALASSKYSGLLGNKILERFDIVLDIKNSALYLKPNEDYSKDFDFSRLGFKYTDRSKSMGYWIVRGIWKESAAEKAGIILDQKITHVNGIAVQDITYKEQKLMIKTEEKLSLRISSEQGIQEVEVPLKSIL